MIPPATVTPWEQPSAAPELAVAGEAGKLQIPGVQQVEQGGAGLLLPCSLSIGRLDTGSRR